MRPRGSLRPALGGTAEPLSSTLYALSEPHSHDTWREQPGTSDAVGEMEVAVGLWTARGQPWNMR